MEQVMPQPQFVMVPVRERNILGAVGFVIALIGLAIPTGLVSLLGLMLSLAAIGRAPRGFAIGGTIVGLIGLVLWLLITIVAVVAALVGIVLAAVGVSLAFMLTQPEVVEVTADMVNVGIAAAAYEEEHSRPAAELGELELSVAMTTDPWGNPYRYQIVDGDPGFDVSSGGRDGRFGTDDDIQLSRLDRLWEQAMADFEERMEQLGERLEQLDGGGYGSQWSGCEQWSHGDGYARAWSSR